MPHSSSDGAEKPASRVWSQPFRVAAEEARLLADLLGLEAQTIPLILPMLWLGKSAVPQAMRDLAGDRYFALQEAQDFVYARPLRPGDEGIMQIHWLHENSPASHRLLITVTLTTSDGTHPVTLKSIIRLMEKPQDPHKVRMLPNKTRPTAAIDVTLPPVDQTMINRYAALSGDDNPVHLDPAFAQAMGLPAPIVHGMMLAGLSQRGFSCPLREEEPDVFPLHLSCRFLLPVPSGQKIGLSCKQTQIDERRSERVTILSETGPHLISQIHFSIQPQSLSVPA